MATPSAKLFSWNWKDAGKAAIMLFITTVVTAIFESVSTGAFPGWDQIKTSLLTGALAAIGYLAKNFLSNSDGQFVTKEKP